MARASSSGLSSVLAGGEATIVARATPPGGALAVIRISGALAYERLRALAPGASVEDPWRARLVTVEVDGVRDEAVLIPYRAPRSYTGEDMVELILHGSPWLVERAIDLLASGGARRARPGEFSRRAVANGKMDLARAEGIRDLVSARTRWEARMARARAAGSAARLVEPIRRELVELLASAEAAVDFSDDGVEWDASAAGARIEALGRRLESLVRASRAPTVLRGAVRAVLTGPPNAGKSSLFNLLVSSSRAIVSPHPGTTRDTLEAEIVAAGRPVVLVDTAGIGRGGGVLEAEGVRRAEAALVEADLVLLVVGADQRDAPLAAIPPETPVIRIRTRTDLVPCPSEPGWLRVNPVTGEGEAAVRGALETAVERLLPGDAGEGLLSPRQAEAASRALEALRRTPLAEPELVAESLRGAARALEEVTGTVDDEAVLDRIFESFCLGK